MQDTNIRIQSQWTDIFGRMIRRERFPHTMLLEGRDGYGVLPAARQVAAELMCRDDAECRRKLAKHLHPDLREVFPTAPVKGIKNPVHSAFYDIWNDFTDRHPFGSYNDWMTFAGADNKQGIIRVADAEEIEHMAPLYPSLSPVKVFILWHAEKMNISTANKMLKLLEEPPDHTYFILTTDDARRILPTIYSRTQHFTLPPLRPEEMKKYLLEVFPGRGAEIDTVVRAARGDMNEALKLLEEGDPYTRHKDYFVRWVRAAYSARSKPSVINDLVAWSEELAAEPRAFQNEFLRFAMEVIRQSTWENEGTDLAYLRFDDQGFELGKFAPFVHRANREAMYRELNDALVHLARNANPKLVFMELALRMTRLLHAPKN